MKKLLFSGIAVAALLSAGQAMAWSLKEAAEPYKGTTIKAIFLDRPGYAAAIKLLPQFEQEIGIKVEYEILPYENTREREVLDFTAGGEIDVVLSDVVWIGEYADSGWMVPLKKFTDDPALADPALNLKGFFPILLESFGTWNKELLRPAVRQLFGPAVLQQVPAEGRRLRQAAHPATWDELMNTYGPKLTHDGKYAYALQSRRGETQSADSFKLRMLWPFGGSLLNADFKSNLTSEASQKGLKFRQELMKYMPPGIVDFDHAESVKALAQGQVAMITEWSSFYSTLVDPATSKLGDCLGVATEPKGEAGLKPALGGFSLGVASQASEAQQKASWLFIQWVTSEAMAKPYVEAGGVSGRTAVYDDPEIKAKYAFVAPTVESWQGGVPSFRPRFPEWPAISEIIGEFGTKIMLGEETPETGAQKIGERMEAVLQKAGYYDGKKEKLQ